MAEETEKENADYYPADEIEVDADVTSLGTAAHEGLVNRDRPRKSVPSRDESPPLSSKNESGGLRSDPSTVSSPAYLLGAIADPNGGMDGHASLQMRLDQANAALHDAHKFLYEKCQELNEQNRDLVNRNDDLMRRLTEVTMENHNLKEVLKLRCRDEEEEGLEADSPLEAAAQKPMPTTSIGNCKKNVNPLAVYMKQEGLLSMDNSGDRQNERAEPREARESRKDPSPEECANFLAGRIRPGDNFKEVLRNLKMGSVDIDDVTDRHPNDPREQRVDGFTRALSQLPHRDRIQGLLDALVKAGLRFPAEEFCREFEISERLLPPPLAELQPQAPPPVVPAPDPKNRLEEALKPFIKDPRNLPLITEEVKKEKRLTDSDKMKFKKAFLNWKYNQSAKFDEYCVSLSLLGVLNAWASVELAQYSDLDALPAYSVECLVRSCRSIQRVDLLKKLKNILHTGVVGPSDHRDVYLRDISHTITHDLIALLNTKRSDGKDWRALAESAGYNRNIPVWQSEQKPAEHFWSVWTSSNATVGDLYDWALKNKRLDIVAMMEN